MTMAVMYFHGFNSAVPRPDEMKKSKKMNDLIDFCSQHDAIFIPVNVDYQKVEDCLVNVHDFIACSHYETILLVGTSLGGWFARVLQLRCADLIDSGDKEIIAVGLNPSVKPYESLKPAVNKWHTNYVTGAKYLWHRYDLDDLKSAEESVNYKDAYPFYVFIQTGDEVIDPEMSSNYFKEFAAVMEFTGGSHRFEQTLPALYIVSQDIGRTLVA